MKFTTILAIFLGSAAAQTEPIAPVREVRASNPTFLLEVNADVTCPTSAPMACPQPDSNPPEYCCPNDMVCIDKTVGCCPSSAPNHGECGCCPENFACNPKDSQCMP